MSQFQRVCIFLLIAVLIVTTIPLWGRVPIHPCLNMQPYRTPHAWQWRAVVMPENGFHHHRPLCLDIPGAHTIML